MKHFHKLVIPVIILIVAACSSNINWGNNNWRTIIKADGKGYYAYLPAAFIYHDLNFTFFDSIEKSYANPQIYYNYRVVHNNKTIDKYFVGTAIAMSPFFLAAHALSVITGTTADGYSMYYLIFINIAAVFYLFVALVYIRKILKLYQADDTTINVLLVAIVFASNVFYYVVAEPAMSHIYSMAFISIFIYHIRLYFNTPANKHIFLSFILLGLICSIRPVNMLVVFAVPFLAGSRPNFINGIHHCIKHSTMLIFAVLCFLFIVSLQLIIYKIQCGSFFVDAYPCEQFNWGSPQWINFLFSYRKGFFIYTPLALLGFVGLYSLYKESRFQFFSLLGFLLVMLYVLSAWWCWSYGGSFSSRVCVDYYALLCVLLFMAIRQLHYKRIGKFLGFAYLVCCLFLCQLQTYQYRYYYIHWDKMDKHHYWNVFLRLDLVLQNDNPNKDLLNAKNNQ